MLQFYQNIYLSKRINNYSTIIKINFLKYSLRLTNFVEFLDIMIDSDVWKEKKYIDTLKLLAIFGVISLHIFQIWNQRLIFNIDIIYGCSEISRFGSKFGIYVTK